MKIEKETYTFYFFIFRDGLWISSPDKSTVHHVDVG